MELTINILEIIHVIFTCKETTDRALEALLVF